MATGDQESALVSTSISTTEFKKKFYQTLLDAGIVEKLKSQIRSSLIDQLRMRSNIATASHHFNNMDKKTHRMEEMAMLSLLHDFLKEKGFEFSISVVLPESGLNQSQILSIEDILKIYHLDSRREFANLKSPFLGSLLQAVSDKLTKTTTKQVQTEEDPNFHLFNQLYHIEEEYEQKVASNHIETQATLEQRMVAYQKECDQRMRDELNSKINIFKEEELKRMRSEERHRFEMEIEKLKTEFEADGSSKVRRIEETERQMLEHLKRKQDDIERVNYQERQRLLQEFENLKIQEHNLKREAELNQKALKLEEEKVRQKFEEAIQQYHEAQKVKEEFSSKLRDEVQKYQLQFDREQAHLLSEIRTEKTKVETEREVINEKFHQLEYLKAQTQMMQSELHSNKEALNVAENQLKIMQKENEILKQAVLDLKSSNETLQFQTRTSSSNLEIETLSLKKKLSDLESTLSYHKDELARYVKIEAEMTADMHKIKKTGMKWQKHAQLLQVRLDSQISENDELIQKIDELNTKNKEMSKEVANTRLLLHHAQTALQGELALGMSEFKEPIVDLPYYETAYSEIQELRKSAQMSMQRPQKKSLSQALNSIDNRLKKDFDVGSTPSPLRMSELGAVSPLRQEFFDQSVYPVSLFENYQQRSQSVQSELVPKSYVEGPTESVSHNFQDIDRKSSTISIDRIDAVPKSINNDFIDTVSIKEAESLKADQAQVETNANVLRDFVNEGTNSKTDQVQSKGTIEITNNEKFILDKLTKETPPLKKPGLAEATKTFNKFTIDDVSEADDERISAGHTDSEDGQT